ncbi:MAG: hypothetical protein HY898_24240 [Deltaproteobacteria bacterium]|nr:hypothetical protein [Deltaproteobacteria bacterium]
MAHNALPDPRTPRLDWIAAAGAGAAAAAVLVTIFALTAPTPPSRPDMRQDAAAPAPKRSAQAPAGSGSSAEDVPSGAVALSASGPSVVASVANDDSWPVVEGMARDSALDTLTFHEPEIRRCLSRSAEFDPGMPVAPLWITMTVRGDGTVVKLETLEDGVHDEAITGCVEKILRKMHFRRKGGKDATVSMRWRF